MDPNRLTEKAQEAIRQAQALAQRLGHPQIDVEHLAVALLTQEGGVAAMIDVRQAEVVKGQSDVEVLRATQLENEAKLDLLRRMGVEPPVSVDQLGLTDSFPVTPPEFKLDELLGLAEEQNPLLRSLRARQSAATWSVRAARSEFLPTLSVQAGWSGFTRFGSPPSLAMPSRIDARSTTEGTPVKS